MPATLAPPSYPWPSRRVEESVFRLKRQGQTVQTYLPASNSLFSHRSVTPPRGVWGAERDHQHQPLSVWQGRRIRLSPPTTRSFATSGPCDRRHSRLSSTAYGPHTGHFLVQCFTLHHPEQGRHGLSFVVEDVANPQSFSTPQHRYVFHITTLRFLYRISFTNGRVYQRYRLGFSAQLGPATHFNCSIPSLQRGSPDSSKQRLKGVCATARDFPPSY